MIFETPTSSGMAVGSVVSPVRIEETPVSHLFFHPKNIEALHTSIRYKVYQSTGKIIDRQGDNQLRTIMTGTYSSSRIPSYTGGISAKVREAVGLLNASVVNRAVGEIISAIRTHERYLTDIGRPRVPLDHGEYASRKGSRSLELTRFDL